jgi:hypothetical protein
MRAGSQEGRSSLCSVTVQYIYRTGGSRAGSRGRAQHSPNHTIQIHHRQMSSLSWGRRLGLIMPMSRFSSLSTVHLTQYKRQPSHCMYNVHVWIFRKDCYFCRLKINHILTIMSVCSFLEFLAQEQTTIIKYCISWYKNSNNCDHCCKLRDIS